MYNWDTKQEEVIDPSNWRSYTRPKRREMFDELVRKGHTPQQSFLIATTYGLIGSDEMIARFNEEE